MLYLVLYPSPPEWLSSPSGSNEPALLCGTQSTCVGAEDLNAQDRKLRCTTTYSAINQHDLLPTQITAGFLAINFNSCSTQDTELPLKVGTGAMSTRYWLSKARDTAAERQETLCWVVQEMRRDICFLFKVPRPLFKVVIGAPRSKFGNEPSVIRRARGRLQDAHLRLATDLLSKNSTLRRTRTARRQYKYYLTASRFRQVCLPGNFLAPDCCSTSQMSDSMRLYGNLDNDPKFKHQCCRTPFPVLSLSKVAAKRVACTTKPLSKPAAARRTSSPSATSDSPIGVQGASLNRVLWMQIDDETGKVLAQYEKCWQKESPDFGVVNSSRFDGPRAVCSVISEKDAQTSDSTRQGELYEMVHLDSTGDVSGGLLQSGGLRTKTISWRTGATEAQILAWVLEDKPKGQMCRSGGCNDLPSSARLLFSPGVLPSTFLKLSAADTSQTPVICQVDGSFDTLPFRPKLGGPSSGDLTWPNNIPLNSRFGSSEPLLSISSTVTSEIATTEADSSGTRYEDGEVRRFGAGESYRPFNRDRSPRGVRSPIRDRGRTPPGGSDSYIPGRSPRRRSRSGDRYRYRDRSREREGDTWRRRDTSRGRARSQIRRHSPRRTSTRRSPRRLISPRRDEKFERERSPRRDVDSRDSRRRSRSPQDRERTQRVKSPARRSPPAQFRGGSYRPRSRSPERRDDRYGGSAYRRSSPPKDSVNSPDITSRSGSRRSSPRPSSTRAPGDRSRHQSPLWSPPPSRNATGLPQTAAKQVAPDTVTTASPTSPPRGPAALRQPPTGPSASRNFTAPAAQAASHAARYPPTPGGSSGRNDTASPPMAPAGPRGYVPPRAGGFAGRGGRGGWSQLPPRHVPGQSVSPTIPPSGPSGIPTGPRNTPSSSAISSPSLTSAKSFNPPSGPAAQHTGSGRPTLAQNLLASMPPIIPGGRIDPNLTPLTSGVVKELEPHHKKLKEEEERIREEIRSRQEKLRRNLRVWDKLERETKAFELKSDLSEKSLKNLAGEGLGGAAF